MSELVYNDGISRVRTSRGHTESDLAQNLGSLSFGPRPEARCDGAFNEPYPLEHWRDLERRVAEKSATKLPSGSTER